MNFDDVTRAVNEARNTLQSVDHHVEQMAKLIAGRLRAADVSQHTLRQLKKELRDYNPHTGKWK